MSLVTTKKMFENALNSDYAVGAFNVNNHGNIRVS